MDNEKRAMKLAYWANLMREAYSSGLKISVWCKQNQLSTRTFYYWHRQVIHSTYCSMIDKGFQPPVPYSETSNAVTKDPVFAELKPPAEQPISRPDDNDGIIIRYRDFSICLKNSFSETSLEQVLRVIRHA